MTEEARTTKRMALAALGFALVLAGPIAYGLTLKFAWLRASGLLAWSLMTAGLVAGVLAARADRRLGPKIVLAAGAALTIAFVAGFVWLARLPPPQPAAYSEQADDFTLPDENGTQVRLSSQLARGPVLLVFYRGAW